MFFFKLILAFIIIVVNGCVTGPLIYEMRSASKLKYEGRIPTELEVVDKTEIPSHDFDFIEIKRTIEKEIARENLNFEDSSSQLLKMKFTYFKCESVGSYPTGSKGINVLIRVITFGLFPIGEYKKCPVSLDVVDISTNEVVGTYSMVLAASDIAGLFDTQFYPPFIRTHQRITVPMKKLITQFQKSKLVSVPK
tara:strand:+ start:4526 stop:5107 length:582 start_codon:yes stop_codon:yes gene_type:complete